jgi:hypothetical protein
LVVPLSDVLTSVVPVDGSVVEESVVEEFVVEESVVEGFDVEGLVPVSAPPPSSSSLSVRTQAPSKSAAIVASDRDFMFRILLRCVRQKSRTSRRSGRGLDAVDMERFRRRA